MFSSSAETDVKRRSRIGDELFEVLQLLKSFFQVDRLDFRETWEPSDPCSDGEDDEGSEPKLTMSAARFHDEVAKGNTQGLVELLERALAKPST